MSNSERLMILMILIISLSISIAVIKTAYTTQRMIEDNRTEREHLPSKCEQYYNDGTDRWKDCMGVDYVN